MPRIQENVHITREESDLAVMLFLVEKTRTFHKPSPSIRRHVTRLFESSFEAILTDPRVAAVPSRLGIHRQHDWNPPEPPVLLCGPPSGDVRFPCIYRWAPRWGPRFAI